MIEAKVKGYKRLFVEDKEIERLAGYYTNLIIQKGVIGGDELLEEEECLSIKLCLKNRIIVKVVAKFKELQYSIMFRDEFRGTFCPTFA